MTLVFTSSQSASVVRSASFGGATTPPGIAAAFTRMSTPPSDPDSDATIARTDSSSPVSHANPTIESAGERRELVARIGDALRVARGDADVGSLEREPADDRFADPATPARDDRALAVQFEVHAREH